MRSRVARSVRVMFSTTEAMLLSYCAALFFSCSATSCAALGKSLYSFCASASSFFKAACFCASSRIFSSSILVLPICSACSRYLMAVSSIDLRNSSNFRPPALNAAVPPAASTLPMAAV